MTVGSRGSSFVVRSARDGRVAVAIAETETETENTSVVWRTRHPFAWTLSRPSRPLTHAAFVAVRLGGRRRLRLRLRVRGGRVGRLVRVDAAVSAQRVPAVGAAGRLVRLGRTAAADRLPGARQRGRGAQGGPRRTRPPLGPRGQLLGLPDRRPPSQLEPLLLVFPFSGWC